jgi:hypothetical protein
VRHIIDVDYNQRDPSGRMLRRSVPAAWGVKVGDEAIVYEPSDGTETDAIVKYVGPVYAPVGTGPHEERQMLYLDASIAPVREMHRCSTPCDSDCEDYCHEEHQVPWKREAGHPYPRVVNGVME